MTRLQTRYLAASVGLLAALIVSFGVIMVFVSDLINNAYPDFVVATAILLFCSTSSALIWELCRRRIWVAIFIVAALPSLCGMVFVLVTLGGQRSGLYHSRAWSDDRVPALWRGIWAVRASGLYSSCCNLLGGQPPHPSSLQRTSTPFAQSQRTGNDFRVALQP